MASDYSACFRCSGAVLVLKIQVVPRASRNGLLGIHNGRLKIAITAAPTDGKANALLIRWLARWLRHPQADFEITQGITSRLKEVLIKGIAAQELCGKLDEGLNSD